jgi:hypothetical protein
VLVQRGRKSPRRPLCRTKRSTGSSGWKIAAVPVSFGPPLLWRPFFHKRHEVQVIPFRKIPLLDRWDPKNPAERAYSDRSGSQNEYPGSFSLGRSHSIARFFLGQFHFWEGRIIFGNELIWDPREGRRYARSLMNSKALERLDLNIRDIIRGITKVTWRGSVTKV